MSRALIMLLAGLVASSAPACEEDCDDPAYYVAGVWSSSFHCSSTGPDGCFTGTDMLTLTQAGDAAAPGADVSFSDGMGGQFAGTLCGNTLTWAGRGTAYEESGTWVFSSADRFTKATAYDNDDGAARGCCAGEGARMGAMTPAPPAQCPSATCSAP